MGSPRQNPRGPENGCVCVCVLLYCSHICMLHFCLPHYTLSGIPLAAVRQTYYIMWMMLLIKPTKWSYYKLDTYNDPLLALQGTLWRVNGSGLLWLRLGADGWLSGRRWLGGSRLTQGRVLVCLHVVRHLTQSCITAQSQLSLLPSAAVSLTTLFKSIVNINTYTSRKKYWQYFYQYLQWKVLISILTTQVNIIPVIRLSQN